MCRSRLIALIVCAVAASLADLDVAAVIERAVGLEGAPNFRDVGGYATADGRHVREGVLYRSGELSKLTPADVDKVDGLRLKSVIDLRTQEERRQAPTAGSLRSEFIAPEILYESPKNSLAPIMHDVVAAAATAEGAKHALVDFYAGMPDMYRSEYAEMFHRLAAGRVPMLVHCTAGKDRTGVAVAVLLASLGVPNRTVIEDYQLTERLVPPAAAAAQRPGPVGGAAPAQLAIARLPEDSRVALWRADPVYIESALASIDREYGSVEAYLRRALELSPAEIETLRREFLR